MNRLLTSPSVEPFASGSPELAAVIHDPTRLAALAQTGLLDSAPERAFDRLTQLATQLLNAPVAMVSLVDDHRQYFKSIVGLELTETPLSHSFCKHVVARNEPLVVENARTHPLVWENPVIEAAGVVAYLGIPLSTPDGQAIGSLCAIDHQPRQWTAENRHLLEDLAEVTMSEIALRQATREQALSLDALRESERFARSTVDALSAHICILDERGDIIAVNQSWREYGWKNARHGQSTDVGANYLEVCEAAPNWPSAVEMAAGIRRVLSGAEQTFELEYPCHGPAERCWFIGRVTPFAGEGQRRVVVAHENITPRKEAEAAAQEANRKMQDLSRTAGMAEVATSVLHNVGNVLNSANVSLEVAAATVGQLKAPSLGKMAALMRAHQHDLPAYFASAQGTRFPEFLSQLAAHFAGQQTALSKELASLRSNVEHINQIVAMQQNYARSGGVIEEVALAEVINHALALEADSFTQQGMQIARDFDGSIEKMTLDRHQVLQILVNLIRNARHAMQEPAAAGKTLTVSTRKAAAFAEIVIADQGVGISAGQLTRIFEHGFTTKKTGHGFGLHSSAIAARNLGGELRVASPGPGLGATFTLTLPRHE